MTADSPYLTIRESCAYLKRSREWLRQHARQIGCYREDGRVYFAVRDLDQWRERSYVAPPVELAATRRRSAGVAAPGRISRLTGLPRGVTPDAPATGQRTARR